MAVRRMIHRDIVCSDEFISMSFAAQALFIQLVIESDEFGFSTGAKRIMRAINVGDDILSELIDSGFIFRFDSGVILVRDWDRMNTRKNDRQNKIAFPREFSMLRKDENNRYVLLDGNQWNPLDSQRSLAELSGAKPSGAKPSGAKQSIEEKSITTASASSAGSDDELQSYFNTMSWADESAWKSVQGFRKNMSDSLIIYAIKKADGYDTEPFGNLRRILYDYAGSGIRTVEQALEREAALEDNRRESQMERGW